METGRRDRSRWLGRTLVTAGVVGTVVALVAGMGDSYAKQGEEARIVPVFANPQPAANKQWLHLMVDARKVLGWVSGTEDRSGREVRVTYGDKKETVIVQRGNTFTWHYKFDERAEVTFAFGKLTESVTLKPLPRPEPTAFFVVDRTVYRPGQKLQFAAFLREPDARGDFQPITSTEVEVEIRSVSKKALAEKVKLTSDDFGRITGEYAFVEADALDDYSLAIKGYEGTATVKLGEFRKSKVKLKIAGKVTDRKLALTFRAVDFLDKPVSGSKVRLYAF